MKSLALVALVACAALAAALLIADPPPPSGDPHAPLREQARCPACHQTPGGEVEPDAFVAPVIELCTSCHGLDRLGRSHPYGVDPSRSRLEIQPPPGFPLEDGKISCGTCHRPHGDWASLEPSYLRQEPVVIDGVSWYPTFFLRIPAQAEIGFARLCRACHRDR